ncbi:MAG: hypothetical protein ACKVT1_05940 [Dehalococcoidia bacterium]
MYLRVVRATIAPGMTDAYWAWAKRILDLWDAAGVRRAGGPYAATNAAGEDAGIWLTIHETEAEMRDEFQRLYADGPGRELIAERPPLVAHTEVETYADWDVSGPPPAFPWLERT